MRERKPYPNISDEELDRRAEEALRRMLNNPKQAQQLLGQPGPHGQNHANAQGQGGHQGGHQGGQPNHSNQNQPGGGGRGKRRQRRRPR